MWQSVRIFAVVLTPQPVCLKRCNFSLKALLSKYFISGLGRTFHSFIKAPENSKTLFASPSLAFQLRTQELGNVRFFVFLFFFPPSQPVVTRWSNASFKTCVNGTLTTWSVVMCLVEILHCMLKVTPKTNWCVIHCH